MSPPVCTPSRHTQAFAHGAAANGFHVLQVNIPDACAAFACGVQRFNVGRYAIVKRTANMIVGALEQGGCCRDC
eukprot:3957190-Prymnesium_polylepis.2